MPENRTTVTDPVCGMTISPEHAAGKTTFKGQTYHFCSTGCKTKFEAAPGQYAVAVGRTDRG